MASWPWPEHNREEGAACTFEELEVGDRIRQKNDVGDDPVIGCVLGTWRKRWGPSHGVCYTNCVEVGWAIPEESVERAPKFYKRGRWALHSSNPIDVFLKFVCFVHQDVDSRPTTGVDVEYDPTTMQAKYTGKQFLQDRDKKAAAEEGKKGWKVARGHDGRMYYINMETGETTWDDPTAGGEEERRLKLTNDLTAELDTNLGQEDAVRALGNEPVQILQNSSSD